MAGAAAVEWPTLGLIVLVYAIWGLTTAFAADMPAAVAIALLALATAQHSSLQHEVIHGHPFRSQALSDALVFPAIGFLVSYERFRDLHLAHHRDENLTDPYDDPESNYLDPAVWVGLPGAVQALLRFNNTLLGRMLVGPAIGMALFWSGDVRAMLNGDWRVLRAWGLHLAGAVPVLLWLSAVGTASWWVLAAGAYFGLSILRIRTFLEHRAHEKAAGRSVIIEDRGPLSILFLNNNFHALHHAAPRVAWYRLPALYEVRKARVLTRNRGYRYASYLEVFRRHLLTAKDPVPHPLYPPAGRAEGGIPRG